MRTRSIAVTVLLAGVAVAAGAPLCLHHAAGSASGGPPPAAVPVVAAKVLKHAVPIYLRGVGTVIAYNNVVVRSQITGQLIKIAFTQGQTVKKGDLLAEIDPRPYQAQLDHATANRDRDQSQFTNAQANSNCYTALAHRGR